MVASPLPHGSTAQLRRKHPAVDAGEHSRAVPLGVLQEAPDQVTLLVAGWSRGPRRRSGWRCASRGMEAGHPAAHKKKDRRCAREKICRRAICCSSRHERQVICRIRRLIERGARGLDDGERGGLAGGRRGGLAGGGIGWADRACGGPWRRPSCERESRKKKGKGKRVEESHQ
jgi:hypothetical protein